MRVGWIADRPTAVGGAELTQAEFRMACPDGIEIIDCPAGATNDDCDRYVIHNCVTYTPEDLRGLGGRPTFKYHHDVGPHIRDEVKAILAEPNVTHICCSPLQAEHMGIPAVLIPPPVDLDRFTQAAHRVNDSRAGSVCVGSWRNIGKAPHRVFDYARQNGGVDFYGGGPFAPSGSEEVAYQDMPDLLARYSTFIYLPAVLEPFGRVVAEAWAAGCEIVTNGLVGARYWIEERPESLETAAEDFWRLVLSDAA